MSETELAVMNRYFYFQLANIYVTVTAGSIVQDLTALINSPSSILTLLGKQLPTI
ncbi:unnamed protein product, partial [Discosporangium mesarthrocarpum]